VGEYPATSPADGGFNPHGIDADFDRNLLVTSDFINPVTTLNSWPGPIELRSSLRFWNLRDRRIVRTVFLPDQAGTMDVKLIPGDPHGPWEPDARDQADFAAREFTPPSNFDDDYAGRADAARGAEMRIADMTERQLKISPPPGLSPAEQKRWKFQRFIRDYLACVASIDRNLGRVLAYLDRSGLRENTLVIYTSDQGFFLGEHGWYDKRFMYEESIRMPFIARWPAAIKAGTRSEHMALNVDFAPTFLAVAGLRAPADVQGRSLLPLLQGETPAEWRTSMYYRFYHTGHNRVSPHWGVRTGRHKLIYFNRLDQWELYDLQSDPREMRNVYADVAYAATVTTLKAEIARHRAALDDRDQFADIQKDNP
jgi:arylsulfatase A-like enzyme